MRILDKILLLLVVITALILGSPYIGIYFFDSMRPEAQSFKKEKHDLDSLINGQD